MLPFIICAFLLGTGSLFESNSDSHVLLMLWDAMKDNRPSLRFWHWSISFIASILIRLSTFWLPPKLSVLQIRSDANASFIAARMQIGNATR